MKIRMGFVTNSSSYGFHCVHIDNPALQDILRRYSEKNELIGSLGNMESFLPFAAYEGKNSDSTHTLSVDNDMKSLDDVPDSLDSVLNFILDIIDEANPGATGADGTKIGDFLDGPDRELFDLMGELEEEIRTNKKQLVDAFDYVFFTNRIISREGDNFKPGEVAGEEYEYSKKLGIESTKFRKEHYQWQGGFSEFNNNWYEGTGFEQTGLILRFEDYDCPFEHTYKLLTF